MVHCLSHRVCRGTCRIFLDKITLCINERHRSFSCFMDGFWWSSISLQNKLKEISSLCKRCNGYWTGYALSILFCIFLHFYAKIPSFNFSNSFILLLASFLFGVPTMLQGRRRRKEEDYSNEHVFSYGFYAGIGTILSFIAIYSLLHNVPL